MEEVKLKEEQELWEPAEVENTRIKDDPDCGGVQSPHEAPISPVQIKEEPKEVQIKQESIRVIVIGKSEEEESLLHETGKDEDRDGAEGENSSDTDDSADWTPSAESPSPQTEQLQEPTHGNDESEDGGPDKPHRCSHCGKGFSTRFNLKRHVQTHTGEKPFGCSDCSSAFALRSDLTRHIRCHTGEKPFRCSDCGSAFALRSDLKRHTRSHTGEKPFRCSVCAISFSRSNILKAHMATHTGEKPFSCEVCGKSFPRNGVLKIHMRIHTRERFK